MSAYVNWEQKDAFAHDVRIKADAENDDGVPFFYLRVEDTETGQALVELLLDGTADVDTLLFEVAAAHAKYRTLSLEPR